jgi:hypothetical protein
VARWLRSAGIRQSIRLSELLILKYGDSSMMVDPSDGKCRSCSGQLEIVAVDDATMDVVCSECGDDYKVEPDAFNDGGIKYWPAAMVEFGEGE